MPIKVESLSHVYSKGTPFEVVALDNVNLTIDDHEFVAVIGQTGSGKSTLVQHFNALLKPSSGTVTVDAISIAGKGTHLKKVRQKVGLVFQFPEHQLFEETVYKDIAFGPRNVGLAEDDIDIRVRNACRAVGIPDELLERSPFELSGGQMRRVAIAGVLAMGPKILILDEPTAGLDPRGREEVLQLIQRLHSEQHLTIILVSHSMEDVARVAKRLIVMHQGRIALDGTPKEVFKQYARLQEYGLGVPQVTLLLTELKGKGFAVPDVALTVAEARQAILSALTRG